MPKYTINLEKYITAERMGSLIEDSLGGPKMGGNAYCQREGDESIPEQGGLVTLIYNEHYEHKRRHEHKPEKITHLYTLRFNVSKEAVLQWTRLIPDLNPWYAVANQFEIEGELITEERIKAIKKVLAGKKSAKNLLLGS